jgi:DNA polymerase-3 subunit delta'
MSFHRVIGQEQACGVLVSALRSDRVPHAYLFIGPEGVGKRTTALQWAKALTCLRPVSAEEACESCRSCVKVQNLSHPDVLWVNFDYQARLLKEPVEKQKVLKIDTVREMERTLRLKPLESRAKVAFVEPADRLVEAAAHALLKILEEPPPETHLVLLALDASQLLATIRSRCQWVRFRPLSGQDMVRILSERRPDIPSETAESLAQQAEGSVARALALSEESEDPGFDWETASLSDLFSWCEQFQNPRLGRDAAERFLRKLLGRFRAELQAGQREPQTVQQVLNALHQIRQYVTPSLVLQVLLLKFRYERKNRPALHG